MRHGFFSWAPGTARLVVSVVLATFAAGEAAAQGYPVRAIRIVVPFSGGAAVDVAARRVAVGLAGALGQPVIVDNRPGAGGVIGTDHVAKAAPDGYTLLMGTINTHAFNSGLYRQLPYDPVRDFAPITRVSAFSNVLVVPSSLGVTTVKELLDAAKRNSKPLAYASLGTGSSAHLAGELLAGQARVPLVHVPYKDIAQYVPDVLNGRVDMTFANIPTFLAYIRSGKIRALAVASAERSPLLPDVPTLAEAGYKEAEMPLWVGLFAPHGTPVAVVETLNKAVRQVLENGDLQRAAAEDGSLVQSDASPTLFRAFVEGENRRWRAVMKKAGIVAQ